MKNLTKAEINKNCNEIIKNGGKPYALVKVSAEMCEIPKNGIDIFYADTMPQIAGIFEDKDKALDMLAAQGALSVNPFRSPAGTFYKCSGFVVCGLIDEFDEGEDWSIDTDDIIDDSPSDVGDDIKSLRAKAKMSQAKFAAYFGMNLKTLQNWEQSVSVCPEYVRALVEYKLKNENIIE